MKYNETSLVNGRLVCLENPRQNQQLTTKKHRRGFPSQLEQTR